MHRLPDAIRFMKCTLGILLIVSFFLPWVAQTPSCLDRSVVIRDNISGFALAEEGAAPEALLAPLFGAIVAALCLIVRGRTAPFIRSLVSLFEIPASLLVMAYIDLSVRLFTPFIIRYGYVVTMGIFFFIPLVSLSEVVVHFPRLTRAGKIGIAAAGAFFVALVLVDNLSRLFR